MEPFALNSSFIIIFAENSKVSGCGNLTSSVRLSSGIFVVHI